MLAVKIKTRKQSKSYFGSQMASDLLWPLGESGILATKVLRGWK